MYIENRWCFDGGVGGGTADTLLIARGSTPSSVLNSVLLIYDFRLVPCPLSFALLHGELAC
ncbi:hypothetical protein Plhal703r1_c03g0014431 [Plasmopara halstedii]